MNTKNATNATTVPELSTMLTETKEQKKTRVKKPVKREDLLSRIMGFFGM